MHRTPLPPWFAPCLASIGGMPEGRIAVAVSGGADSTALLSLCLAWKQAYGAAQEFLPMAVDHRLRQESAAETELLRERVRAWGLELISAVWAHGGDVGGNVQTKAREARYALLETLCRRRGIQYLMAAHHRDDQAETVLLRLLTGAGPDGLCGMAPVSGTPGGLTLLRPLLDVPKRRLTEYLEENGIPWIEDPSNASPKYRRNEIRMLLDGLNDKEEAVRHVALSAKLMRQDREEAKAREDDAVRRYVRVMREGYVGVCPDAMQEKGTLPFRLLSRVCRALAGSGRRLRAEDVLRMAERLRLHIARQAPFRAALLGHIAEYVPERRAVFLYRELSRCPAVPAVPGERLLWDGRFVCVAPPSLLEGTESPSFRALGTVKTLIPRRERERLYAACPAPKAVQDGFPVLCGLDKPPAYPHIFYKPLSASQEDGNFPLFACARRRIAI
jgi:tRNA(Ile)-lysidine synthase